MINLSIRKDHLQTISKLAQTCKDETRINLFKTVLIEKVNKETLSFTATDGYVLFQKHIESAVLVNEIEYLADKFSLLDQFHNEGLSIKFNKQFTATKKELLENKTILEGEDFRIINSSFPRYKAVIPCLARFNELEPSKVWTHFNLFVFEKLVKGLKIMGHDDFKFYFRDDLGPMLLEFRNSKDIAVVMPAKKDY